VVVAALLARAPLSVLFAQVIAVVLESVTLPAMGVFLATAAALAGLQPLFDLVLSKTGIRVPVVLPYALGPASWGVLFSGLAVIGTSVAASLRGTKAAAASSDLERRKRTAARGSRCAGVGHGGRDPGRRHSARPACPGSRNVAQRNRCCLIGKRDPACPGG
jgi:hypothetical protein